MLYQLSYGHRPTNRDRLGTTASRGCHANRGGNLSRALGRLTREVVPCYDEGLRADTHGESHSLVVHELWELVVAGSNPASPTDSEHSIALVAQLARAADF